MPRQDVDLFAKCKAYVRHKEAKAAGVYPYFIPLSSATGPEVIVNGRKMIMIGSNNYLGLTQHPKVHEAAKQAIDKYGVGCTGSRFLNGTIDLHLELEQRLAKFVGKAKALVFSTGFQTNLGTISCLVDRDDVILCDRMNHASIIDATRLSFGETVKFKHNDVADLERILQGFEDEGRECGKLIVVDGVFSMEGDIAPLPEIARAADKFGARLMVDDAHAIGVMGKRGAGTADHFGVTDQVDLIMGTFSKTFASLGGFVAGDVEVIDYIQHHARSLIFAAAIPPSNAATVLACLNLMESDTSMRDRLWKNAEFVRKGYRQLGFNTGGSQTPVIPVILGDFALTLKFWRRLFDEGIYVNAIVAPAVPESMCLLRTSYMATHEEKHLKRVLDAFEKVGKELKVI
ncbi:MAG TPA: aminotransferase class I/II-fold pyridoxal phosphate-dependent enzyme [Planctomycetota bacterium]|nr:aminotransferase class I/II-fold pyridoxal phosphate-dependent enzyme [Planctomycetota bacterium]